MIDFNFKKFHYRSINAQNEAERAEINQELKDLYETLSEEDKAVFNEQLQSYLIKQYKTVGSDYEALKESGAYN